MFKNQVYQVKLDKLLVKLKSSKLQSEFVIVMDKPTFSTFQKKLVRQLRNQLLLNNTKAMMNV